MKIFTQENPRLRLILASIILLAVILRVGVAVYLGNSTPPKMDETSYSVLAARVADGYGFTFPERWYPGFTPPNEHTAHWSFLYTSFVASIYAIFGYSPLLVRIINAVLCGVLMPWMIFRLGRQIWPEKENLALLAAAISAFYAYFALFAAKIQTEGLFLVTVIWSLERSLVLLELLRKKEVSSRQLLSTVAGLGLSLGLATSLRQSILPWIVVLFGIILLVGWRHRTTKRTFISLGGAGLIVLLFILPWTLKNYQAYDDFLLLNSNAGYALYSAQHPQHGTNFQAFLAVKLPKDLDPLPANEAEWDRALMKRGLQFIIEDPLRYGLLSLSRVVDFVEFWPSADTSLENNIGRVFSFGITLPFIIFGLWVSFKDWRRYWLLYTFIVFYSSLHILTWAMVRYRLPVDAILILFAALGLAMVGERLRRLAGSPIEAETACL